MGRGRAIALILSIVAAFAQMFVLYALPGGEAFLKQQFDLDHMKPGPLVAVYAGSPSTFQLSPQWQPVEFQSSKSKCRIDFDIQPRPAGWAEFQGPIMPGVPVPANFNGRTKMGKYRVRMSATDRGDLPWFFSWMRGDGTITFKPKC